MQRLAAATLDVLSEALNEEGRYDARKMAACLHWQNREMAQYLKRDPSAISVSSASELFQEPLARLGAVVRHAERSFSEKLNFVRAWLKTPVSALDNQIPKTLILEGRLDVIRNLLDEFDAGGVM